MTSNIDQKMAELRQSYLDGLPDKVAEVERMWLHAASVGDEQGLHDLHRLAHSLAGSGAIFQQEELGQVARMLELHIKSCLSQGNAFSEENSLQISRYIKELKSLVLGEEVELDSVPVEVPIASTDLSFAINPQRLLVVEDDDDSRHHLALLLESAGHKVTAAASGEEAVAIFDPRAVDAVLMDVVMPGMTGYEATIEIKRKSQAHFTPVIFLTSVTDDDALAKCIESGGDDFISKPYNGIIINAKLKGFERLRGLYQQLESYKEKTEEEIRLSHHLFEAVIQRSDGDIKSVLKWAVTAGQFSGDMQLVRRTPSGRLHIMLGDVTGHGLSAAVGTLITADLFYDLSEKDCQPDEILAAINDKLKAILPTGWYCAAGMMSVEPAEERTRFWNCGLPIAYALKDGEVVRELSSNFLPLGITSWQGNDGETDIVAQDEAEMILMLSDGVTEARGEEGVFYDVEGLLDSIAKTEDSFTVFDTIKHDVLNFIGQQEPSDDISLIAVNVATEFDLVASNPQKNTSEIKVVRLGK